MLIPPRSKQKQQSPSVVGQFENQGKTAGVLVQRDYGQILTNGEDRELEASGNPNLVENTAEMMLYRLLADAEVHCDVLIGIASDNS